MTPLKFSYQHAKKKSNKGTLYSPLKNKFGNDIIPRTKNILSIVSCIQFFKKFYYIFQTQ
jgi:hypothetical protein